MRWRANAQRRSQGLLSGPSVGAEAVGKLQPLQALEAGRRAAGWRRRRGTMPPPPLVLLLLLLEEEEAWS